MTAIPKKTAKPLGFEITAPVGMGLSKGETGLGERRNELAPWLQFTIRPPKYPDRQQIWLVPKDEKRDETKLFAFDRKTSRLLTPDIMGSLFLVTRGLAIIEEPRNVPTPTIGTLAHCPVFTSASYGHAESYGIELNLNEKGFNDIRDIFLAGRSPSGITIWTPDVEYGGNPDGNDKIWEVWETHSAIAKIVGYSLTFSVDLPRIGIGLKKSENEEEDEREETEKIKTAILHSREDIQLLCFQQDALNTSFGRLRKQISILIYVSVAIAIIAVLHFAF